MKSITEKRRKRLEAEGVRLSSNSTLRAGSGPKRGGKIKAKRRSPKSFARVYGSVERVLWIKRHACYVAIYPLSCGPCEGEIQNAHTVSGGKGRKADASAIIPLCAKHHRDYDEYRAPFDDKAVRANVIAAAMAYDLAWTTRTER